MLLKRLSTCFHVLGRRLFSSSCRTFCVIRDRNFEYFRNQTEYKNSVVQLSNDMNQSGVTGPACSFILKEHNFDVNNYFSHLEARENVMKLSAQQVKDVLSLMANIKIDVSEYKMVLKYLDEKCALNVERWPLDLTFYVLDAWFIIWGSKLFKKHYYYAITNLWGRRMNKCSRYNLILMLYFIGLSKEAPPFLMEIIEERMEHFASDFSAEEWAIACLGFFKTSTRINSNLLLSRSCDVIENLIDRGDRFNTISILKCLRLSRYYDVNVWKAVQDYVLKDCQVLNFVECTNFLATFSTQNIYHKELFDALENRGISVLQLEHSNSQSVDIKTHPSLRSRAKDIARFLWALCSMGHDIKSDTLHFLCELIKFRLELGEFDLQWYVIIDCMQSMALTGHYPSEILQQILNPSTLKKLQYLNKSKPKYQLYFIQRSTQIEKPEMEMSLRNLFHPIPKSLEKDVTDRKGFLELVNILNENSMINFKCCYLIPHIMISGILLGRRNNEKGKNGAKLYKKYIDMGIVTKEAQNIFENCQDYICLEILDPSMCVNQGIEPHGLMKAKIRQLQKLNFDVLTILPDKVTQFTKIKNFEDIGKIKTLLQ